MTDAKRIRRLAIFDAAYSLLAEKGYKGTSMLAVARAAGASNETMYNWFGSKQGLMAAMIEENAHSASGILNDFLSSKNSKLQSEPIRLLETFGDMLLELFTSEKTIALARAAAADVAEGGNLGDLINIHGRKQIMPQLISVVTLAQKVGIFRQHDPSEIAEIYYSLLLSDIQVRRVIGVTTAPTREITLVHSQRVIELMIELFGKRPLEPGLDPSPR